MGVITRGFPGSGPTPPTKGDQRRAGVRQCLGVLVHGAQNDGAVVAARGTRETQQQLDFVPVGRVDAAQQLVPSLRCQRVADGGGEVQLRLRGRLEIFLHEGAGVEDAHRPTRSRSEVRLDVAHEQEAR